MYCHFYNSIQCKVLIKGRYTYRISPFESILHYSVYRRCLYHWFVSLFVELFFFLKFVLMLQLTSCLNKTSSIDYCNFSMYNIFVVTYSSTRASYVPQNIDNKIYRPCILVCEWSCINLYHIPIGSAGFTIVLRCA